MWCVNRCDDDGNDRCLILHLDLTVFATVCHHKADLHDIVLCTVSFLKLNDDDDGSTLAWTAEQVVKNNNNILDVSFEKWKCAAY